MNADIIAAGGVLLCGMGLLFTGSVMWLVGMFVCSCYWGWELGKRLLPADTQGV